jgi:hypothetical protein
LSEEITIVTITSLDYFLLLGYSPIDEEERVGIRCVTTLSHNLKVLNG